MFINCHTNCPDCLRQHYIVSFVVRCCAEYFLASHKKRDLSAIAGHLCLTI